MYVQVIAGISCEQLAFLCVTSGGGVGRGRAGREVGNCIGAMVPRPCHVLDGIVVLQCSLLMLEEARVRYAF